MPPCFAPGLRLSSAVLAASAIRLEEYYDDHKVLTARPLTAVEFQQVVDAVPMTWDYGAPPMVKFCFNPHHRIVITDAATQRETAFRVCFQCDQVSFPAGVMDAPAAWH